jgi:hypothetical protein
MALRQNALSSSHLDRLRSSLHFLRQRGALSLPGVTCSGGGVAGPAQQTNEMAFVVGDLAGPLVT